MNYDDINEESLYDSETADYSNFHKISKIDYLLEKSDDIEETDVVITADNFCSKFVSLIKDIEDIKFEMSKLRAEVQNLHNQAGIVIQKLK